MSTTYNTLTVALGDRSYPIYIGQGLLAEAHLLAGLVRSGQVVIVTDNTVAGYYLSQVVSVFEGFELETIVLPAGEQHKTVQQWQVILDRLCRTNQHRNTTLIALGGGVVGDMTGFAAACYHRGVAYLQFPTTLLAQVDASVGGKTAVNHAQAKNVIGAFWQPSAVVIDVDTLKTLPEREYIAGLAEVVKYGLIADRDFFAWLTANAQALLARQESALMHVIQRCCAIKAAIVADDELDQGQRAILNFGHSFGHAFEVVTHYDVLLHGEAVAIGMAAALKLSVLLGYITDAVLSESVQLLKQLQLPVSIALDQSAEVLLTVMRRDKKNTSGELCLIGLRQLGEAIVIKGVAPEDVYRCLAEVGVRSDAR